MSLQCLSRLSDFVKMAFLIYQVLWRQINVELDFISTSNLNCISNLTFTNY